MNTNEKDKLYFDIDGYFHIALEAEEDLRKRYKDPHEAYIKWATNSDSSIRDLFDQYYWLLRSSLVLIEEHLTDREKAIETFKSWRHTCIGLAISLTDYQLHHKIVPQPHWLQILKLEFLDSIKEEFPNADNIAITSSMEPRFTARAQPANEIKISSHVYAILKALNTSLLLTADGLLNDQGKLSNNNTLDIEQLGRFSIPHYIFLHDFIPVASLPYTSFPSMELYAEVTKLTNLQVNLIISHEYAHFALGHLSNPAQNKKDREKQEEEADMFALRVCFRIAEDNDHYKAHDIWCAYRFLYQYHVISETISNLLRDLEYSKIPFIMFSYCKKGGIAYEDINFGSKWCVV